MSRRTSLNVAGFRAAGVRCGLKPSGTPDLALIVSDREAAAAGVFTTHRVPGAPVVVSRPRARKGVAQAIVANSGCSNVATGEQGLRDARAMGDEVGKQVGVRGSHVLIASTGVIGEPLPMDKIRVGIGKAAAELEATGLSSAARAIMTTDTKPKLASVKTDGFTLAGIAKGSGMLQPNMATMLAFLVTDVAAEPQFLREALREAADATFNRLTIDGEMSTSDMTLLLANGAAGGAALSAGGSGARTKAFVSALQAVCGDLAEQLAVDGEGVTRIAEIHVHGARNDRDAERVARKVGNSALFKTALFGADPNWGRIVQAAGAAGVAFAPADLSVKIGAAELMVRGEPRVERKAAAAKIMKQRRVPIEICIGSGPGRARLLTTDLSYDYVRINAEYTT
jgi:glutamate N-acetyltransferase / amino-acid N-acetyltransferase